MLKTLQRAKKEHSVWAPIPHTVRDLMPVRQVWEDGIFCYGGLYSRVFRFSDINYLVAGKEDQAHFYAFYCDLLNALDAQAAVKITVHNRAMRRKDVEQDLLMALRGDRLDRYRREYNRLLLDATVGAEGIRQDKYLTVSVRKKDIREARAYLQRIGAELTARFAALDSKCTALDLTERMQLLREFFRPGEEALYPLSVPESMRCGHDLLDTVAPDGVEINRDWLRLGDRWCRILYLKDCASYLRDSFVSELTELRGGLVFSMDVLPVPTEEAIREVESRLLGVETNISATRS